MSKKEHIVNLRVETDYHILEVDEEEMEEIEEQCEKLNISLDYLLFEFF